MPASVNDSRPDDFSAKDEKAPIPLAEIPLLSKLSPPPVPFMEKAPDKPGRISFQSTKDAYKIAKKVYDDSQTFYKQTTVAAKKAEYDRLYQDYAKQFDTPFKKLFQIPQGKVPPTMDFQTFSQNLLQVLQQKDYKSNAKPQPKTSNNKMLLPFPAQLDLFIKTSLPLLEGVAKGTTIGLPDLIDFKDLVRGRYSMDVWIPDRNSANTAFLLMQSLNVLASPDAKNIPGFGDLLERKTDTLAGLTLAPFVDRDKTLYTNLLPYVERYCKSIATALNQYFEQQIKLPQFTSDVTTDKRFEVVNAKLLELSNLRTDFSLVTPFGDYTPTLDDHVEILTKQLNTLIEIKNSSRPISPVKLNGLGVSLSPGPQKSTTTAVAERLMPVPSVPASAAVLTLAPAAPVSGEHSNGEKSSSKMLVARKRTKHHKNEDIADLRRISDLNEKIAQIKLDMDQKKRELKHAKDFDDYQRLLRRQFHDRVVHLTDSVKHVVSVNEKARLANELKGLANTIHMEDAAVSAKQQAQRYDAMFRDIGERADAARKYVSDNKDAEEKAKKLETQLEETIATLDKAVAEQKNIIRELKNYLENVGLRTSKGKIKLAKDFMAELELCVDSAHLEKKLLTSQYSRNVNVEVSVRLIGITDSGPGIYATNYREESQLKHSDYFLPPIASMRNAVTAVDAARRRFREGNLRQSGDLLKILNKAQDAMNIAMIMKQNDLNKNITEINKKELGMKDSTPTPRPSKSER